MKPRHVIRAVRNVLLFVGGIALWMCGAVVPAAFLPPQGWAAGWVAFYILSQAFGLVVYCLAVSYKQRESAEYGVCTIPTDEHGMTCNGTPRPDCIDPALLDAKQARDTALLAVAQGTKTTDEGRAMTVKGVPVESREWCLRTDGASAPLPCSLTKGHSGPCYFRN